ncbi:hypothetical protein LTR53_005855 [Teratosphaeriaceae sp. CCFEE 6253]|nr:hypothetical protein LTR53_005855 [Teratosphaeriaceae sp. CCFEE 6253]
MPIFDPIYRPSRGQQSYIERKQQSITRKRKREDDEVHSSDEDDETDPAIKTSPSRDATPKASRTPFQHPVSRTDPYHVAGHSRQDTLPPPPFPHAAVKDHLDPQPSVEDELAALNPPLFPARPASDDQSSSLKRRHVDNLTTLLHTCMLRGDWQRACRAWGLLLRTEIGGHGPDIRQQGRWGIGGELLMRREFVPPATNEPGDKTGEDEAPAVFSDAGFQAAREYYERLILQYPHTPHTQHNVNALAFYPGLFNIWIYEVQDRAKRRRAEAEANRPTSSSSASEMSSDSGTTSDDIRQVLAGIRRSERDEALPIAQRMDELLVSPPYDSSAALLELRGMVGLWLADLYAGSAEPAPSDDESRELDLSGVDAVERSSEQETAERGKAMAYFRRAEVAGVELPRDIKALLDFPQGAQT